MFTLSVSHTKSTLCKAIVIRSVQHLTTRILSELDPDAFCEVCQTLNRFERAFSMLGNDLWGGA